MPADAPPLLAARGLYRAYPRRSGISSMVAAVDGVDLELAVGESLGVVGESGSGKSTLARLLLAIENPDRGVVLFDGRRISGVPDNRVRPLRRHFQGVFQDPTSSLDPRMKVGAIVAEPLAAHRIGSPSERRDRVHELLATVGLPGDAARRHPGAFSGGERQRIAIARALAPGPRLLVLDEPVSSLDVSVQAQILDLIGELRQRLGLSLVLISHNLEVVREICGKAAIMHCGRFVEHGPTKSILSDPAHPYTKKLLDAAPQLVESSEY